MLFPSQKHQPLFFAKRTLQIVASGLFYCAGAGEVPGGFIFLNELWYMYGCMERYIPEVVFYTEP